MIKYLIPLIFIPAVKVEQDLRAFKIGYFPIELDTQAFGQYGLLGDGSWWLDCASSFQHYLYSHTIERDGMPIYHDHFQPVTHTYMNTMTKMGAGAPTVGLLMHRNRQLYEYFIKLSSLTFVTNSVGLPHEPPKTLFKKDEDCGIVSISPSSICISFLMYDNVPSQFFPLFFPLQAKMLRRKMLVYTTVSFLQMATTLINLKH